jgi:hypothetical protein
VPRGLGVRVVVLASALVAVAVVSVFASWGTWTIIAVMAVSFLIVSAIEIVASRREGAGPATEAPPAAEPEPAGGELPQHVRVLHDEHEPESEPEPAPVAIAPEREPPVRPPLAAVSTPQPAPPSETEPEPEPQPTAVVPIALRDERPREWNLWELERASRDAAGQDPFRDEERNYLLMYLREFASPEGTLPADFDALVRDSFGDLLASVH